MNRKYDCISPLEVIDPDESYDIWSQVGMALKHEGYSVSDWIKWSKRGHKFHAGECENKWKTFNENTDTIVTGKTISQLAMERGWKPPKNTDKPIAFNAILTDKFVDPDELDTNIFEKPGESWDGTDDLISYLEALFDDDDIVGYVTKSKTSEDGKKFVPADAGSYVHTCRELIDNINRERGENEDWFSYAFYGPQKIDDVPDSRAGAWIHFNPLDGQGVGNDHVKAFRYSLVESDNMPVENQLAIIKAMNLPCAAIVYSGNKSVHAIVHIDAKDREEYRQRVQTLYETCENNGLTLDKQNKNPSRLSRMPGVMRGNEKQFLIATNQGAKNWDDWQEWRQDKADKLPPFESLADLYYNPPELSPALIHGILREGHKMMLSGPSKAGKSFLLIELCIAMAEGLEWFGFKCEQCKVLYANMEIDRASCIHRFIEVYKALGIEPKHLDNIEIWNLRGKGLPLKNLAPILVRRACNQNFSAIMFDPIYKLGLGDENSAQDVSEFCNQLDYLCASVGVSLIYCHHHSKGKQGAKSAIDRASGSGVFSRDADALIDMVKLVCPEDATEDKSSYDSAYRIEGTLREFENFEPFAIWFKYPIHELDKDHVLNVNAVDGSSTGGQEKGRNTQKLSAEERRERIIQLIDPSTPLTKAYLSTMLGVKDRTIEGDLKKLREEYSIDSFKVGNSWQFHFGGKK